MPPATNALLKNRGETLNSQIRQCLKELHEDGIDPSDERAEPILSAWLGQSILGATCHCGRQPLLRFEFLNGRCERCRLAEVERDEQAKESRDRFSNPMLACNVPAAYQGYTLLRWEGPLPDKLMRWAKKRDDDQTFAVISGSTGSGKTHLAMILLMEAWKHGIVGLYVNARLLPPELIDDSRIDEHPLWTKLTKAQCLVVDDVGAETDKAFAADKIAALIESRFLSRRKTIVTTNLTLAAIYERDNRIGSRLHEGIEYLVTGSDRRI